MLNASAKGHIFKCVVCLKNIQITKIEYTAEKDGKHCHWRSLKGIFLLVKQFGGDMALTGTGLILHDLTRSSF